MLEWEEYFEPHILERGRSYARRGAVMELIESRNDINKKCELMAEERMLQELFEAISGQEKKLSLFNKYGFLLVENHSDPILREYCKYVSS
jgi:hypothetical protein